MDDTLLVISSSGRNPTKYKGWNDKYAKQYLQAKIGKTKIYTDPPGNTRSWTLVIPKLKSPTPHQLSHLIPNDQILIKTSEKTRMF